MHSEMWDLSRTLHSKSYGITTVENEKKGTIFNVECHECAESQGSCKYAAAFLMRVHRMNEEQPTTSVECSRYKGPVQERGSGECDVKGVSLS